MISVNHSTVANGSGSVVLLNHDSPNAAGTYTTIYDDSGENDIVTPLPSQPSDGPGSLGTFTGQQGMGVWLLHASDNAPSFVGSVQGSLFIQRHQSLQNGTTNTVAPKAWFYDYIDVPSGYTNLTVYATNVTASPATPPLQLYLNVGVQPSFTNYLFEADLTNPPAFNPGNSISYGPPLQPARYWIGVYNPSAVQQDVSVLVKLNGLAAAPQQTDFGTNGPLLTEDAVTTSSQFVSATNQILSVNVGMVVSTNARISDYTFTLVSPTGQRVLLMENRGGPGTYGAGSDFVYTNVLNSTATGGAAANTNYLAVDPAGGPVPITYDFFTVPDEMTIYEGTNPANFYIGSPGYYDTGFTNGSGTINFPSQPGYTNITIIMNQFGNPDATGGDAWTYTAGAQITNYQYLVFTEDTNLTATPIKFAVPPFVLTGAPNNYVLSDFESATNGDYFAPANIFDTNGGWSLSTNDQFTAMDSTNQLSNEVSVVSDPADSIGDNVGSNYLALARGTITRPIPTIFGRQYNVTFWYRGPGISSWWRGEGDATDSSDPERNANNGSLIGRFDYPAGEVGQAFQLEDSGADFEFAGTNNYIQVRQSSSLDVGKGGGFTVEGWINPTNFSHQEPLVEWLAQMPTNGSDTNLVIEAGPFLDRLTSHYYYLLGATNWTISETWATQLGGHLATVDTANEENWIYDTFASYTGTNRGALWIGLTNAGSGPNGVGPFGYSSGLTNVVYTNWANAQPANCDGNEFYTAIVTATNAESGLWVLANNNGISCPTPTTNIAYGVVEVNNLQTNGVQLWISVTNTPGTAHSLLASNGCLYADIVDTSNVTHEIFSAPGLIQSNLFQHVALTYNTNSGIANLFYDGTNVASTNFGGVHFVPKTGGDVLLGKDMSLDTNNYYGGEMDEMSVYSRALSDSEIQAIYRASYFSTNRTIGKFDPTVVPAEGLAEARVSFGGSTNVIFGLNRQWEVNSFTFTAASNSMPLQISGLEPGMLLDDFDVSETPLGNLYYLPEQSLDELAGSGANGTWTLEVWDNRANALATNADLVNWQLQFVLQTNVLATPLPVGPQDPTTITVPPGQTVLLSVPVPSWAKFATNILDSASAPVNLYFNPTNPPTGSNPGDAALLIGSTGGVGNPVLTVNTTAPFGLGQAGQSYYLGVSNPGTHAVTAVVEVDFDITVLSNNVPVSSVLNTNDSERYFAFDVSSNAFEATFQLLNLSGNADLVVRKGSPLPTLLSSDYGSFNATNAGENIYVLTNSSPVKLSAGRWYLGAIKRDTGAVNYTILAKELFPTNQPGGYTIIPLTNGVPFNYTAGPGAALTNFFSFTLANNPALTNAPGLRFELYNLSGNGDLTVQTNAPPFAPPFFQSSQNPGRTDELIDIRTNSTLTNLAANWYLGVPDNETNSITYTILAEIDTNTVFPAFPGAEGAGAGALGGRGGDVYHVVNLNDDGPGSLRYGITSFIGTGAGNTPGTGTTGSITITNISGARTIVFDVSGTIELQSPLVITNSYLTIAGQTSPHGITVAGDMTAVQTAHDVVIRYVRFRPGYLTPGNDSAPVDSLKMTNVSDVVADHISASWSTNEIISALNSSNVTVQWSVIADSLNDTNNPHGYGSLLRYGNGMLSFHHNLYADNYNASPRLGDNLKLDFVNNVIYDWGTNAGFSTNDISGVTNELNYECNYLIAGPDSRMTNIAFSGGTANTWVFQTNNFMDGNGNGILDGADTGWNMFTNITEFGRPFNSSPPSVDEAFIGYERVQDFAGASMGQRDLFDTNIVGNVRAQTGAIISNAPLSGLVAWWKAENNANDSAGNNSGFWIGTTSYTNGEVGQAFNFNGANYVQVPDAPSLRFTTAITVEAWVKIRTFNGVMAVVSKTGGPYVNQGSFDLSIEGSGQPYFNVDTTNGADGLAPSSIAITTNQWIYIAGTYDGSTVKIYVNGQLEGTTPWSQVIFPGNNPLVIGCGLQSPSSSPYAFVNGLVDEVSIYNRALSASEIALIYNAGTGGKLFLSSTPPLLDTDQDGIPDYWETTLGEYPAAWSANNDRDLDGYTDLEEYMNWLAVPHALAATNAPVDVDLNVICGKTGNLSFSVTNAVNGSVYLTNVLGSVTNTGPFSNSIAVFTPTNNFGGFASFDFFVTNNATVAFFGPVTVSVMNSAVPVLYGSVTQLTNSTTTTTNIINSPTTNGVVLASNSIAYFSIFAPTNADYATNILNFATGPLNMWFNQNLLPSGANFGDFELLTNSTGGRAVLGTNAAPSFIPGQTYYLALQNTNSFAVTNYAIEVDFHLTSVPAVVASPPVFGGVKVTGGSIQLQWNASSGAQVQVQWATNLASQGWITITNPATTTSNGVSTFTDDGSQTAPLGKARFYRLVQPSP